MRKKNNNELFVQNLTQKDVLIGDIGIKVPANKTVNIFFANPYLTKEKVYESITKGSLKKRISAKILKIVSGIVSNKKITIEQIKVAGKHILARRKKSNISIEVSPEFENEEIFDFADYGVNDIMPKSNENNIEILKEDIKQNNTEDGIIMKIEE